MANQINVTSGTGNIQVTTSRSVIAVTTVANANVANTANYAGNVTVNAQPNITSLGTLTSLTSSGNITAPYFIGNVVGNISGNIVVPGTNTSVLFNQVGSAGASDALQFDYSANVLTVDGNANVTGKLTLGGNIEGNLLPQANGTQDIGSNTQRWNDLYLNGNTIYLGSQTLESNATHTSISGVIAGNGAGLTNVSAASANSVAGANVTGEVGFAAVANSVAGANVSGTVANATYATSAGTANTASTVTTAAQPNITSVGTLTGLAVNGNITANVITANTLVGNIALTQVDYIDFDTGNGSPGFQTGRVYWDGAKDTLAVDMNAGGNITQQVGEDQYIFIKANATITAGQVVMFNGVQGDTILGAPANTASAGFIPRYVMGVAPANIANGASGYVQTVGEVYNLQTNAFTAGSILYLQANSNGALTATEPTAPDPKIVLAACLTQSSTPSATNGRIQVRPDFGYYMDQLHDVSNVAATTGDVLVYNASNVWTPSNTVPLANLATYATTANAVAGANVSGEVANANFASYANVANAANAVAVANVFGIGNIATINLDGSNSNVLYGNGTFAPVTVTLSGDGGNISNINGANVVGKVSSANVANFVYVSNVNSNSASTFNIPFINGGSPSGNYELFLDGSFGYNYNPSGGTLTANAFAGSGAALTNLNGANVTGTVANATFATSAGSANTAGTVTTAAQPNITSVGNLTSLTINANVANSTTIQTNPGIVSFDGRDFLTKIDAYDDGNGVFLTNEAKVLNNYGGFGIWETSYYANTSAGNTALGGYISFNNNDVIGNTDTDPLVHSSIDMIVYTNISNLADSGTQTFTSFGLGNPGLFLTVGGQTTSPVFTTIGYGDGGSGSVGMRMQRRRGDGDNRSNVAAGDYVANLEWRAAGTSTGGFNSAIPKIAPRVDAGYAGAGSTVPVGFEVIVVNGSNTQVTHNFYANGNVSFANSVSVAQYLVLANDTAANVANLTGVAGAMITVSDQDYQPAYWSATDNVWKYVSNRANV